MSIKSSTFEIRERKNKDLLKEIKQSSEKESLLEGTEFERTEPKFASFYF